MTAHRARATWPLRAPAQWARGGLLAGALAAALLAVGTGGCTVHAVREDPPPGVDLPGRFSGPSADRTSDASAGESLGRWWESFGDGGLTRVVGLVLDQNLDLRQAWARLKMTGAVAKIAGAASQPQVDASAGAGATYQRTPALQRVFIKKDTQTIETYSLSVGVAYEVDLWGKVRATKRAAALDRDASRLDAEAMAMTLAAQTTETWFSWSEARAQRALLDTQIELNKTTEELLEMRLQRGLSTLVAVYQQRQQRAAVEAQVPLVEAREETLAHQLAVLMGRPPSEAVAEPPAALPDLPPAPAVGLPVSLLERRPDVRAARARLVAADYRVAVAIADRYPALRLSGKAGFNAADIADFFDSWLFNLIGNLVAPLFDGGRRAAEVERTRAVLENAAHGYSKAILTALKEVEDALTMERYQRTYLARLDHQLALSRTTLDEARVRYMNGLGDYLPVLTALAGVQKLELSQLTARRQLLSYRVQLYRALGGVWTQDLAPRTNKGGSAKRAGDAPAPPRPPAAPETTHKEDLP